MKETIKAAGNKFITHPWRSIGVVVLALLVLLGGLSLIFGAERVGNWVEGGLITVGVEAAAPK